MKKIFPLLLTGCIILASCSKKTHPSVSTPGNAAKETSATPTAVTRYASPLIVIDETGKVITSRNKLPADIATKVNYNQIARSFTPSQRANLIYRFKMVPPRALFVPPALASKTARGYYCVYKKKFWYWKKEDGLFYLDETYYQ